MEPVRNELAICQDSLDNFVNEQVGLDSWERGKGVPAPLRSERFQNAGSDLHLYSTSVLSCAFFGVVT